MRESDYGTRGRPQWLDVDWSSHRKRVEVLGREVEYVELGEEHDDAIVFVHGLGANWQTFLENIPFFARTHHVLALDLPGFGRSPMPAEDISIPFYADVIDALLEASGIEAATIVGNSMGGFVGAEVATRHPHRAESLVLVSPAILWGEYWRAKPLMSLARVTELTIGRYLVGEVPDFLVKRPRLRAGAIWFGGIEYPHRLSKELQRELVMTVKRTDGFTPALVAFGNYPVREELPKISCRTLLVWGDRDRLVTVKHAEQLAELIPDSRVEVFKRTGHVAMLERPSRFNRVVAEFMAESGDAPDRRAAARGRAAESRS